MSNHISSLAFADDSLLPDLRQLFSVLGNSELETQLNKVQLISIDELSDRIRSDSLVGVSACFYLSAQWDETAMDPRAMQLLNDLQKKSIASVILYCSEKESDPVPESVNAHSLIRFLVKPRSADGGIVKPVHVVWFEKMYSLLAGLATLSANEAGAFYNNSYATNGNVEAFGADITIVPHYDAFYVAVKHRLLECRNILQQKEEEIEEVQNKLREVREEPLKICSQNYPAFLLPQAPASEKEKGLNELRQSVCNEFDVFDDALSGAIHTHVSVTHTSMAKIDTVAEGEKPDFAKYFATRDAVPASSAPEGTDLLKEADHLKTERSDLRVAIRAARELGEPGKPVLRSILIAFGLSLAAFILVVGSVYLQQALSVGWQNVDKKLFALLLGIPAALLLCAAAAAWIIGLIRRARIKHILKALRQKVRAFMDNAGRFIEKLKDYLNCFITIFYNSHFRERRITILEKREQRLKREREQLLQGIERINTLLETSFVSARIAGEQLSDLSAVNSLESCQRWIASHKTPDEFNSAFGHGIWETANIWIKKIIAGILRRGGVV